MSWALLMPKYLLWLWVSDAARRKTAALPPAAQRPTASCRPPECRQPVLGQRREARVQLDPEPVAAEAFGDHPDCPSSEEWIENTTRPRRGEAVAAGQLADLADVSRPLARLSSDDARRPRPRRVALHADPLRAGGQGRALDQRLGERGLMAPAVCGRRHRPDVAGVLAVRVSHPALGLELAETEVAALVGPHRSPARRGSVRSADRVEVVEVTPLLGRMDHDLVGRTQPVADAVRHRVRLVPDHDVADDPAVLTERQRQPLRSHEETAGRGALRDVLGIGVPDVQPEAAGRLQYPAHAAQYRAQVLDVGGDGRLLAELSGDAVVAELVRIRRAGDAAIDAPRQQVSEDFGRVAAQNRVPWQRFHDAPPVSRSTASS